ncbi:YedE family putative selenium transporter [Dethiobacter alkaliphilus]|uniref:YedE family putative selenium transporter n=1 Tax=Dethiobacter alkaliphilus TaxID=427926 RepID=UPI0029625416|nr:YedE family putative selenium transporter [Dethiobacter alkaliphilus]
MGILEKSKIIISGILVGLLGVLLVRFGNPANMGVCVACFVRDISGGLGFHRAEVVQYLRPEVSGFIIGAFIISMFSGEFRARGGSSPLLRFLIGMAVMIGALVFLGCPLRMVLRLAAGDFNAVIGLLGFIFGIFVGVQFLKRGFSLGRSQRIHNGNGIAIPGLALVLLILVIVAPAFIFFSASGPGFARAPFLISLGAGVLIGVLVQRSRLCQIGCFRDMMLIGDSHLLYGSLAIFAAALVGNLVLGYFNPGFVDQPVAHTAGLWNFIGLAVVGLGATLLGGCPIRQTILAGEGDTDAGMTFLGLLFGAAVAHNFGLAASPAGVSQAGQAGVLLSAVFLLVVGFAFTVPQISFVRKGGVTLDR